MKKITKRVKDYEFPWYTNQALLEIFPEAKKIVPEKIEETKDDIEKVKKTIREMLDRVKKKSPKDLYFFETLVEYFLLPQLKEYERRLFGLYGFSRYLGPKRKKRRKFIDFKEQIEMARKVPIAELARSRLDLKPSGRNFVALCPFHEEKTPSFYLYTETNSFVCFGCQEKGDVIKFKMLLDGLDFKEAVNELNNNYDQ